MFTSMVLGNLAVYQPPLAALGFECCADITHLSSDSDIEVRRNAAYSLARITFWHGASQIMDRRAVQCVLTAFGVSDTETTMMLCEILWNLAFHKSKLVLQLGLELYIRLVLLTSCGDTQIRRCALSILGNTAAENTGIWESLFELLLSASSSTHQFVCNVIRDLTVHDCASPDFVEETCTRVVLLLRDQDWEVRRYAVCALSKISCWPEYAQLVRNAGTLDWLPDLVGDPDAKSREWAGRLLENMASHTSAAAAHLESELFTHNLQLLSEGEISLSRAIGSLYRMSFH
ncbi:armadillo-type protein [Mycena metata]|uniref:Armadillo-type protein n=1 Tax=Mycena metata TaxID=1033252 RepID=A0AAD7N7J0_9AGAR|nr:armadillo-type protein [Mycena metata]